MTNPKAAAERILKYEVLMSGHTPAQVIAKRYLEAIELLNIIMNSATNYETKFLDLLDEKRIEKFLAEHESEGE